MIDMTCDESGTATSLVAIWAASDVLTTNRSAKPVAIVREVEILTLCVLSPIVG